jgi:hypothetical protein
MNKAVDQNIMSGEKSCVEKSSKQPVAADCFSCWIRILD